MVSPESSSSSMKNFTSLSKDDSGDSKGKTDITSLGKSRWERDSAIEFLAQVIGMVKVSLPSFTSRSPVFGGSKKSFSRGCPIKMLNYIMSKTWKSRAISTLPWWRIMLCRIPSPFRLECGAILKDMTVGAQVSSPKQVSAKDFDMRFAPIVGLYNTPI
jgi:hypothetical protein